MNFKDSIIHNFVYDLQQQIQKDLQLQYTNHFNLD